MSALSPDLWAREAAALPLAFSQVREDPRLDIAVVRALPARPRIAMIASGGDTALMLAREDPAHLLLVDMNPAQLALTRFKWHLAGHGSRRRALELLGHLPHPERAAALAVELAAAELPAEVFGPPAFVAEAGPDHAGRYEVLFAKLRAELAAVSTELMAWLLEENADTAARQIAPGTPLGDALDTALAQVMALANLVQLFGEEATRNPRQPFDRHFARRIRAACTGEAPARNPFLWQMLAGRFPAGTAYDWYQEEGPPGPLPEMIHGRMLEVLRSLPAGDFDLVHLSNIFDWLSPAEAAACLEAAQRVLRPGGRVILRQLNSSLDVPALALEGGIAWDLPLGARLQAADRSFFYPAIHVGSRR